MSTTENLNNLAQEIWKSAESLRGKFKAYEYQNTVLPMITLRRIECVLESWREERRALIKKQLPDITEIQREAFLKKAEKIDYYDYKTNFNPFKVSLS